jgi:acyl-CoA synthetase (AMP-forming)/AMP-acid ligase II
LSAGNFAGRLVERLGAKSDLIDAATAQTFPAAAVPSLIVGFAAGFLSAGLRPGNRVLVSCGVDASSVLAYIGAMYAGCVPVPVDERMLADLGDLIFAKTQAKAAWIGKRARSDWSRKYNFPLLEGPFDPHPPDSLRPTPCTDNDLAALMPTSGSTGIPRLVMVTHGNLIANTEAIIRSQHLGIDERAMLIMPVSYCFGASIVHTHLYQGGGVVFDSRFIFPDKVLQAINTYSCTSFAGVPTVYNILLRRSHLRSIALPSLRRFLQAGGPLAPESVKALRAIVPSAEFLVMYGQTEATARISCLPPEHLDEKMGSAGLPLDNLVIRIVDDRGHELANRQNGEIQVSGPSICVGYLDDPEATQRKFDHGWLRTGDLGFRDEEGYIWIKGRTGEFMKIRGLRLSFAEVEARVATISGVYECAATAVHHPEAGESLALFIVVDNGTQGIVERVRHAIPPQWTCTSVKVVSELPRTANGKVARSRLQTLI